MNKKSKIISLSLLSGALFAYPLTSLTSCSCNDKKKEEKFEVKDGTLDFGTIPAKGTKKDTKVWSLYKDAKKVQSNIQWSIANDTTSGAITISEGQVSIVCDKLTPSQSYTFKVCASFENKKYYSNEIKFKIEDVVADYYVAEGTTDFGTIPMNKSTVASKPWKLIDADTKSPVTEGVSWDIIQSEYKEAIKIDAEGLVTINTTTLIANKAYTFQVFATYKSKTYNSSSITFKTESNYILSGGTMHWGSLKYNEASVDTNAWTLKQQGSSSIVSGAEFAINCSSELESSVAIDKTTGIVTITPKDTLAGDTEYSFTVKATYEQKEYVSEQITFYIEVNYNVVGPVYDYGQIEQGKIIDNGDKWKLMENGQESTKTYTLTTMDSQIDAAVTFKNNAIVINTASLQPGEYKFKVWAKVDDTHRYSSDKEVTFTVYKSPSADMFDYNLVWEESEEKYWYEVQLSHNIDKKTVESLNIPSVKTDDQGVSHPVCIIAENAFSGCSQLTTINIPSSIVRIKERAFAECGKLVTANINDIENSNLVTIAGSVFYSCTSLTEFTVPQICTVVGDRSTDSGNTFYNCTSLRMLKILNTTSFLGYKDTLNGCVKENLEVLVPNIQLSNYQSNDKWNKWTLKGF